MYFSQCQWPSVDKVELQGVIVASDMAQEWLLPWWWEHYAASNRYPVTFVDLGLSRRMQQWCQERGRYVQLPIANLFVKGIHEIEPERARRWEGIYGSRFWPNRAAWFKKPFACLLSCYEKTLWLDLDCQVNAPLDDLFACCEGPGGIALAPEGIGELSGIMEYNGGVIAFRRGLRLIEQWARSALDCNHLVPGDQDLLSLLIHEQNIEVHSLNPTYNWSRCSEPYPEAKINHWHGLYGKSYIQHQLLRRRFQEES